MAFEWTIVDEIRLYRWVAEFKPAGANKHFHMLCILERMNHPEKYPVVLLQKETVRAGRLFTAKEIWEKLGLAYNLAEIDKLEDQEPSPDEPSSGYHERTQWLREVRDFELPWDEYGELILEHARNGVEEDTREHSAGEPPVKREAADRLEEAGSTPSKRRSTRIRHSQRLKRSRPSSDDDLSSKESSDGEERPNEDEPEAEDAGNGGPPLAKRTRQSSQTRTSSETSPKRKKPASAATTAPTRVSSRLRNRKQ